MVVSICLYYNAVGLYYCIRRTWIHAVHEHCGREKYYGERTAVDLVGAIRTVIFCPITALRQRNTRPITTCELITAAFVIWSFSCRFSWFICSQHDKHFTFHLHDIVMSFLCTVCEWVRVQKQTNCLQPWITSLVHSRLEKNSFHKSFHNTNCCNQSD